MCGEALKSELLFRRDAHEIHAGNSAGNVGFDDPKTGGKPLKDLSNGPAGTLHGPGC